MSAQPEALGPRVRAGSEAAPWVCEAIEKQDAELRLLHEAHEWQHKMAGKRLRRIEKLEALNQELLNALLNALPYVEDVLADKTQLGCFKPGVVQKHAAAIRAAIAKAEKA